MLAELGLPPDAKLGVGVDRLDYTKGIEERLLAVERLLERFPHLRGRFTFAQLAAPSRTVIDRYRELNERVDAIAARDQRALRGAGRGGRSRSSGRTTSRLQSSGTSAPRTSATSASCTTG